MIGVIKMTVEDKKILKAIKTISNYCEDTSCYDCIANNPDRDECVLERVPRRWIELLQEAGEYVD